MEPQKPAEISEKEQRIRKITSLYYSRPEVQKAIFAFSANREVVPRYFEGFGKRPDALQYAGDVFELIKKGATSLHCSEELWSDPLKISTSMTPKQFSELRVGWDLLLDIDSKYLDYSKILAQLIVRFLGFYGVKNVGIKFSGSKGFHIIVPWKAFPKEINGIKTAEMFPEWPRIITKFIMESCKADLVKSITELQAQGNNELIKKYISKNVANVVKLDTTSGPGITRISSGHSGKFLENLNETTKSESEKKSDFEKEVMPDLVLVSPRHLFRMPYSLHEKTALASVVLSPEELEKFQPRDADPFNTKIRTFMPDPKEGEASELVREALDWYKNANPEEENDKNKRQPGDFKVTEIKNFSDDFLPPTIKQILQGVQDGRKRALFVLLNLFRSIGMDRVEIERRIAEWNKKNEIPLLEGYIKSQFSWAYRNKIVLPPNYDKDYYKALGLNPTDEEMRYKNPTNYVTRKANKKSEEKPTKYRRATRDD